MIQFKELSKPLKVAIVMGWIVGAGIGSILIITYVGLSIRP